MPESTQYQTHEAAIDACSRALGGNRGAACVLLQNKSMVRSMIKAGTENEIKRLTNRVTTEKKAHAAAEKVLRLMHDEPDHAPRKQLTNVWQELCDKLATQLLLDEAELANLESQIASYGTD